MSAQPGPVDAGGLRLLLQGGGPSGWVRRSSPKAARVMPAGAGAGGRPRRPELRGVLPAGTTDPTGAHRRAMTGLKVTASPEETKRTTPGRPLSPECDSVHSCPHLAHRHAGQPPKGGRVGAGPCVEQETENPPPRGLVQDTGPSGQTTAVRSPGPRGLAGPEEDAAGQGQSQGQQREGEPGPGPPGLRREQQQIRVQSQCLEAPRPAGPGSVLCPVTAPLPPRDLAPTPRWPRPLGPQIWFLLLWI